MSQSQATQVAEIVRFRLKPGVTEEAYLAATQPSHAYASALPGFVSRTLSKSADGEWTDYVIWQTLEDARTASQGFMAQDFAPAMIGAIEEATMQMSHQPILWQPS